MSTDHNNPPKITILPEELQAVGSPHGPNTPSRNDNGTTQWNLPSGIGRVWPIVLTIAVTFVIAIPVGQFIYGLAGSGVDTKQVSQQAILKVLRIEAEVEKRTLSLPNGSSPVQAKQAISNYCREIDRVSLEGCPADFKVSFRRYSRACHDFESEAAQLPNDILDGAVTGFFNSLFRGELDGGASRIEDGVKAAARRVQDAKEELEAVAAKYDASL